MKALVGSWENRPYRLLAENAALRARVAELELSLLDAREENDLLRTALLGGNGETDVTLGTGVAVGG